MSVHVDSEGKEIEIGPKEFSCTLTRQAWVRGALHGMSCILHVRHVEELSAWLADQISGTLHQPVV